MSSPRILFTRGARRACALILSLLVLSAPLAVVSARAVGNQESAESGKPRVALALPALETPLRKGTLVQDPLRPLNLGDVLNASVAFDPTRLPSFDNLARTLVRARTANNAGVEGIRVHRYSASRTFWLIDQLLIRGDRVAGLSRNSDDLILQDAGPLDDLIASLNLPATLAHEGVGRRKLRDAQDAAWVAFVESIVPPDLRLLVLARLLVGTDFVASDTLRQRFEGDYFRDLRAMYQRDPARGWQIFMSQVVNMQPDSFALYAQNAGQQLSTARSRASMAARLTVPMVKWSADERNNFFASGAVPTGIERLVRNKLMTAFAVRTFEYMRAPENPGYAGESGGGVGASGELDEQEKSEALDPDGAIEILAELRTRPGRFFKRLAADPSLVADLLARASDKDLFDAATHDTRSGSHETFQAVLEYAEVSMSLGERVPPLLLRIQAHACSKSL